MSDRQIFLATFSLLCLINGVVQLRRARSGVWQRETVAALGTNTLAPDSMTPRWRRAVLLTGMSFIVAGVLGLLLALRRFFHV